MHETSRRPVNGLCVEIGSPTARCMLKSPDGRGPAWLLVEEGLTDRFLIRVHWLPWDPARKIFPISSASQNRINPKESTLMKKDAYKNLQDAATDLVDAAKAMREADPDLATDLIFALCSAVAPAHSATAVGLSEGLSAILPLGETSIRAASSSARNSFSSASKPSTSSRNSSSVGAREVTSSNINAALDSLA